MNKLNAKLSKLLEILVCTNCQGDLYYDEENQQLICYKSKLIFKIEDGIPNMLIDEAKKL